MKRIKNLLWILMLSLFTISISAQKEGNSIFGPAASGVEFREDEITPNGEFILIYADLNTLGTTELFSIPTAGGNPIRLNTDLQPGANVFADLLPGPNSEYVLYAAQQDNMTQSDLYSVKVDGSAPPVALNTTLAGPNNAVIKYRIDPTGTRVVYLAQQDRNNINDLYSVPIGGGNNTFLNSGLNPPPGFGVFNDFQISADGNWVVYRAIDGAGDVGELFSVPITGGTPNKLSGPKTAGSFVSDFTISPDGTQVVFTADLETDNKKELYIVPTTGGTPIKLNEPLPAFSDVEGFAFTPDGEQVLYEADKDNDGDTQLFKVAVTGGSVTDLSGAIVNNGSIQDFIFTPDGQSVVFRANKEDPGIPELYITALEDSPTEPEKVSLQNAERGGVGFRFLFSSDCKHLIFTQASIEDEERAIFSVPLDGSQTPLQLSTSTNNISLASMQISPNGNRVFYRQGSNGNRDLFSVSALGGEITQINRDRTNLETVAFDFFLTPDSDLVVYQLESFEENSEDREIITTRCPELLIEDKKGDAEEIPAIPIAYLVLLAFMIGLLSWYQLQ